MEPRTPDVSCAEARASVFIAERFDRRLPLIYGVAAHRQLCDCRREHEPVYDLDMYRFLQLNNRNWDQPGDQATVNALAKSRLVQMRLAVAYLFGATLAVAQPLAWRYELGSRLLSDDNFQVRRQAIQSLAEVGFGRSEVRRPIELLLRNFADAEPMLAREALQAARFVRDSPHLETVPAPPP